MRILITGGTGFLGRALVKRLQDDVLVERLCVISRDEHKVARLEKEYTGKASIRTFVGDVRDQLRIEDACRGVDVVIHAAALKRAVAAENEASELNKTNHQGTVNVLRASLNSGVRKVLVVSSDKAAEPCNAYGCSKMMAECEAVDFNSRSVPRGMKVSVVRYGNVFASTGSVYHIWKESLANGKQVQVTNYNMTRFHISAAQAVEFCLSSIQRMAGGEIFVPELPAYRLLDLAHAMVDEQERILCVGLRPGGEKVAEIMLTQEEPSRTLWQGDRYVVQPAKRSWSAAPYDGVRLDHDPHLTSAHMPRWLTVEQLKDIVKEYECTLS